MFIVYQERLVYPEENALAGSQAFLNLIQFSVKFKGLLFCNYVHFSSLAFKIKDIPHRYFAVQPLVAVPEITVGAADFFICRLQTTRYLFFFYGFYLKTEWSYGKRLLHIAFMARDVDDQDIFICLPDFPCHCDPISLPHLDIQEDNIKVVHTLYCL